MRKEDKEIIRYLLNKELKSIEKDAKSMEFPTLQFIEGADHYERELKKILKELK